MKVYNVSGVKLYDHGGDGRPILFIHSFPLSSAIWDVQVDYFKKNNFRVITYDIRGLGHSVTEDNVYSMEKHVNDFFHAINKLKIQKITACGLSMGGYIILRALQKDPERFEAVILVNTTETKDDDQRILQRSNAIIKIKSGGRQEFINKLFPKFFGSISSENKTVRDKVMEIAGWNSDDGICGNLLSLITRVDSTIDFSKIRIPVLIIYGDEDQITDPLSSGKLKEKIINAKISAIKNSGHLCNMENPDEFNRIIHNFLMY